MSSPPRGRSLLPPAEDLIYDQEAWVSLLSLASRETLGQLLNLKAVLKHDPITALFLQTQGFRHL